jgi:DNA-binding NtrC family response regulator
MAQGYEIEIAHSYTAAWAALCRTDFRLAIVDLRLADADRTNKDGLRLLAEMDRVGLSRKAMMLSGYGTDEDERVAGQSARVIEFVDKKRLSLDSFLASVAKAVRGGKTDVVDA